MIFSGDQLGTQGFMHETSYCTISINSAGHVTHYMPAEILNSAHGGNDRYIEFFSADRGNGHYIIHCDSDCNFKYTCCRLNH
jgi:hypothetical protein